MWSIVKWSWVWFSSVFLLPSGTMESCLPHDQSLSPSQCFPPNRHRCLLETLRTSRTLVRPTSQITVKSLQSSSGIMQRFIFLNFSHFELFLKVFFIAFLLPLGSQSLTSQVLKRCHWKCSCTGSKTQYPGFFTYASDIHLSRSSSLVLIKQFFGSFSDFSLTEIEEANRSLFDWLLNEEFNLKY